MPGKCAQHLVRVEVRQVEVDVGVLRLLHAADDGLGHHVARGQLAARVLVQHEADAVLVAQVGALAAHRLADEVAAGAGDVEDRRVELHELHVAQLGAGAVGGRHAVAGGHRRVGRLAVDHAGAAAGQDRLLGPDQQRDRAGRRCTRAPTQRPSCVSRSMVKVRSQRVTLAALRARSMMARITSKPVASPRAWTMRRWLWPPSMPMSVVELGAVADQVVDLAGRLADHQLDDGAVAQAGAGGQRVLDVVLEAVLRRAHGGDAALGVAAVALLDLVLGDDQDVHRRRRGQGGPQPGDAAADDEHVGEDVRASAWGRSGRDSGGEMA